MLTRRSFLWMAGVTAAGAARHAEARQPEPPQPLPPPIAALRPLRDEVVPITHAERRTRIERARRLMAEHRLDAILMTGGTSLVYFTNIRWSGAERLFALVLPAKGDPFIVCPAFEADRAQEQIAQGPFEGTVELRTWQEDESPYQRVAQGLRDRGLATGRLGIEETTKYVFVEGVAAAAPAVGIGSATPVTAGCRMIKSPAELRLMRLASTVTLRAYAAAHAALTDGMTQHEVARLIADAHSRLGFQGGASVQVGPASALPHGSIAPQVIREGAIILIDGGCSVEGYQSDISRTFVLGKPSDRMKRVFDVEKRAQAAALAAARPGVPCEAVDTAARRVIVEAGFGPDYTYFTHRVGHGIGMDGHEWPYLVRGNTLLLAPGMTFSNEPGIYLRGEFGVRLEDDMVITDEGAELFTPPSESLERPFPAA